MPRLLRAKRSDINPMLHDHFSPHGLEHMSPSDCVKSAVDMMPTDFSYKDTEVHEQPIVEVTQLEVKKALKLLQTRQNSIMDVLYKAHEDYNHRHFQGRLSVPIITIEKLSHRTLGSYMANADSAGLENHIILNRNFVALNTETRILETLKHQMIHQYQDEVIYEKHSKDGQIIHVGEKRPKDWHNKDFKDWATNTGIAANGPKCYGSPAKMPEPKSYNRKFVCRCVASNGYPLTIWSTREIKATCQVCNSAFVELKKAGDVIPVEASDVEDKGQDAIENRMRKEFSSFEKFKEKYALTAKVKELKKSGTGYKEGIYQKGHNACLAGYHYWVAFGELADIVPIQGAPTKRLNRLKRGAAK